jgi:EAL domain-containing protein (putative c-di-GMP-specific phosphodiesterase class I)
MLRHGLKDLARVSERGNTRMNLSVSLTRQFMDSVTAVEKIVAAAAAAAITLSRVDIRIDARTLAGGNRVSTRLRELRRLGVRIFLENFGQDDITLARLGSLPIDGVSVGAELIGRLEADISARAACASAFAIARSFGFKSIAAGVAKQSELEQLYEYGCEQATGPLFGTPKPADTFYRQLI